MDEDAVRREVEEAAQPLTEAMRDLVEGRVSQEAVYYERFHKVSVQTWTREDLVWLDDHGFDYWSVLPKEVRPK